MNKLDFAFGFLRELRRDSLRGHRTPVLSTMAMLRMVGARGKAQLLEDLSSYL